MSNCSHILDDNADITGIGVRISFYAQACLTIFVSYFPDVDSNASYWSMTITAFALFVSALSLHRQGQLSLYLAISVSILLYLHAFAAFFVLLGGTITRAEHSTDAYRAHTLHHSMRKLRLSSVPVVLIAVAFSLFVWHHAGSLGPEALDCNPRTILVILGSRLVATETGRTAGLAISYFCLIYLILFTIDDTSKLLLSITRHDYIDTGISQTGLYFNIRKLDHFVSSRLRLSILNHEPLLWLFKQLSLSYSVLLLVGFILSNELTLSANASLLSPSGGRIWTLGQIFPVVMLLVPLFSIATYFLSPVVTIVRSFLQEVVSPS